MLIQHFENKRTLNQHDKAMGDVRKQVAKDLKMRMTVHDGEVKWSR